MTRLAAAESDVFNSSFAPVALAGTFVDPNLPSSYVPYNIQMINGLLYVEYTNTASPRALGSGAVSVFDGNGNFRNHSEMLAARIRNRLKIQSSFWAR
jgi:hypothetical protein